VPGLTGGIVALLYPIARGGWNPERPISLLCEDPKSNARMAHTHIGHSPSVLFGDSPMPGGFAGGRDEDAGLVR
jgi:hypothetical protein